MQIKNPKFKEGQKVRDIEDGDIYTVVEINRYSFSGNEYWYDLEADRKKYIYTRPESKLETYIDKPKTVWDLKKGDTFYVIDVTGDVIEANWLGYWLDYDNDKRSRKIGNAFLTKEEAEFEIERRKVETEMLRLGGRRKFEQDKDNYLIVYEHDSGTISYPSCRVSHNQGGIFFDSDIDAIYVVQEIGEDRIKKYIFGVEE